MQSFLCTRNLPQEATLETVMAFHDYLYQEMRNHDVTEFTLPYGQGGNPRAASLDLGPKKNASKDDVKGAVKGDGKGKKKGKTDQKGGGPGQADLAPCFFFKKPPGCSRGSTCKFKHAKKDNGCGNCGSETHATAECTRPGRGRKQTEQKCKLRP